MCACVCSCECACMRMCACRLEMNLRCLPQSQSTLYSEIRSLTDSGHHWFSEADWPMDSRDPAVIFLALGLKVFTPVPRFHMTLEIKLRSSWFWSGCDSLVGWRLRWSKSCRTLSASEVERTGQSEAIWTYDSEAVCAVWHDWLGHAEVGVGYWGGVWNRAKKPVGCLWGSPVTLLSSELKAWSGDATVFARRQ